MQAKQLLLMALAGAFGTVARYALIEFVCLFLGRSFPYGTFVVNILGCFLFGIVWDIYDATSIMRESTRLILLVGFMGSFTTFSTLIFESDILLRQGYLWASMANMALSLMLGMIALRLGIFVSSSARTALGILL